MITKKILTRARSGCNFFVYAQVSLINQLVCHAKEYEKVRFIFVNGYFYKRFYIILNL